MESNVYIATTRKHLAVGLNTPGENEFTLLSRSTRPFPRVAVGKGSGNARLGQSLIDSSGISLKFFMASSWYRHENTMLLSADEQIKSCYISSWASEASPTLGCSIEISRDISMCVMSNHVESRESNTRMLKVSIGR